LPLSLVFALLSGFLRKPLVLPPVFQKWLERRTLGRETEFLGDCFALLATVSFAHLNMENNTSKMVKEKTKTYLFKVIIEPDEDRWVAYCPILQDKGGATWGYTKEEALKNIREVIQMTVESIIEHGEEIPEKPEEDVKCLNLQ